MKRFILLVSLFSTMHILVYAQTIYHYRLLAEVNPTTGEKVSKSGNLVHFIFASNHAYKCDEYGNTLQEKYNKKSSPGYGYNMYGPYTSITNEETSGAENTLTYYRSEKGMHIYRSLLVTTSTTKYNRQMICNAYTGISYYKQPDDMFKKTKTVYLYVSEDKQRINMCYSITDEKKDKNDNSNISVFELYDIDEITSQSQQNIEFDPSSPAQMY